MVDRKWLLAMGMTSAMAVTAAGSVWAESALASDFGSLAGKDGGAFELSAKDGGVFELSAKDGGVFELSAKDGGVFEAVELSAKDGGAFEIGAREGGGGGGGWRK